MPILETKTLTFLHSKQFSKKVSVYGYYIACLLALVGIGASLVRFLPHELHLFLIEPLYGKTYAHEQIPVLSQHVFQDFLHRILGAAYMLIGLLQFNAAFRKKRWKLHRRLGRVFVLSSLALGAGGMIMALWYPFSGWRESVIVMLAGSWFIYATYKAYQAARARKIKVHQVWMVRSFSMGLAISTIRILYFGIDQATILPAQEVLALSMWLSWPLHVFVTEVGLYFAFPVKSSINA